MAHIHKRYLASISSTSGPSNALSNSTLLDDETPSAQAAKESDANGPAPKLPPEQRILLLQALLAIGDVPASLLLLGKFPWIAQSHPLIADLIMRIIAHAIEKVYRAVSAVGIDSLASSDQDTDGPPPQHQAIASKDVVPTLLAPCPPATQSKIFEFFYPDWREGLEQWTSPHQVLVEGLRWLALVRGLAGRTVEVMVKICRIGAAHYADLRKLKEVEIGLPHGARSKDEIRMVEVSGQDLCCARLTMAPAKCLRNATLD